uniref:Uncharacterized protein n=1 Tax=Entomoneis paludosa TaxID=265537 RepID=A0A7S3DQU2_9STRA|mmetsp:Transcript_28256/g.59112  ORF Transcript_28256/g.59112 Transcript_28256/m.59112 type:complete len:100 (+) Transcript_28256:3-302(+)
MSAYCLEAPTLIPEEVDTLVDNERFANSSGSSASYEVVDDYSTDDRDVQDDTAVGCWIFLYGATTDQPDQLYQNLQATIRKLEEQQQQPSTGTITIDET